MPASTRYPTVLHSKTAVSLGALASARGLTAQGHSPAAGLMHHPQQAAGGPGKHGAASWRALLKIVYLEMIRDCGRPRAGAFGALLANETRLWSAICAWVHWRTISPHGAMRTASRTSRARVCGQSWHQPRRANRQWLSIQDCGQPWREPRRAILRCEERRRSALARASAR